MKLSQWLLEKDRSLAWLGREIGVSTEAARRYSNGDRMPRPDEMRRIASVTDGEVTANDFYGIEQPLPPPTPTGEAA